MKKPDYEYGGVTGTFIFHGKDGWKIMKASSFSQVVAVHKCNQDPIGYVQWKYKGQRPCHYCGKPAPDEIQALITLYNGAI